VSLEPRVDVSPDQSREEALEGRSPGPQPGYEPGTDTPGPSSDLPIQAWRDLLDRLQAVAYTETRESGWDPHDLNSLTEELMHIISEVTEVFEEIRRDPRHFPIYYDPDGRPHGVPIEFADVFIGLLYNAERHGFSLATALQIKMGWNRERRYDYEARQLHP
jgi:hypothetical protein